MKKLMSLALVFVMIFTVSGCGKSKNVKEFEKLVAEIGEVTVESEAAIKAAEEAYAALSDDEKDQTEKRSELKKKRAAYEEKVEDAKAEAVEKKIDAIQEVTLESQAQIDEAKKEYDNLTDENKAKVKNVDKLDKAKEELKTLKAEKAESLLAGMQLDEDRVRSMKFYYPNAFQFYANGSWAADVRCFMLPYIGRDESSAWLRLIYNYTDDDWVFFESIIVAVDGKQYNQSFNYFDIVRDNEAGDVWEYIDTEVSDSDIDMLWAVANSLETIVRFQGDDYSHDYTVTAEDKQAIKEVLTAYEALN